jgi:hypothetical protein
MSDIKCKKLTCKFNVRTTFYGHMCGNRVVQISDAGKCASFERDTPNHIKDKKLNKILGYHDGRTP